MATHMIKKDAAAQELIRSMEGEPIGTITDAISDRLGYSYTEYAVRRWCKQAGVEFSHGYKMPEEIREHIRNNAEKSALILANEIEELFHEKVNPSTITSFKGREGIGNKTTTKQCRICGKLFTATGRNVVLCSAECRAEKKRRDSNESLKRMRAGETQHRRKKRDKRKAVSIVAEAAEKAGVSYGVYVAATEYPTLISFPIWVEPVRREYAERM